MNFRNPPNYNFTIALRPIYREVTALYSLDGKPWQNLRLVQCGLKYYGSVDKDFREILFYFETKSKTGKKKKLGSKKKPYRGLPFSRMPFMQVHLLEPNPDSDFIHDLDRFAAFDIPQQILTLPSDHFSLLLHKYPNNLQIYSAWIKNLYGRQQMRECARIAEQAYPTLIKLGTEILIQYPFLMKIWIKDILWLGGCAAEKAGQYTVGKQLLELGTKIMPSDEMIWSNFGDLLAKLNKFSDSYKAYERAITLNPKNLENYRLLLDASVLDSNLDKAEHMIERLEEILNRYLFPLQEQTRYRADIYRYSGMISSQRGKIEEARANFERGVKLDKNNPFNNLEYAKFESEFGEVKKALALGQHALRFHPYPTEVKNFLQTL